MLFNRQIMNYFGSDALAVFGVIVQISGLVQCFTYAVGQAAQPIISENFSVRNWERIKQTRKYSLWTVAVFGVLWTSAVLLFPNIFVKIHVPNRQRIADSSRYYAYLWPCVSAFAAEYFRNLLFPVCDVAENSIDHFYGTGHGFMRCISVCASGDVWRETSMVGHADYRAGSCSLYYFVYDKK